MVLRVFVYGTLKPGCLYYRQYCLGLTHDERPAIALGQLYSLPIGYPAMTWGDGEVHGYLLSFEDAAVLSDLDELEGYSARNLGSENEYERCWIEVFDADHSSLGFAWSYIMARSRIVMHSGVLLSEGVWQQPKNTSLF